MQLAFLAIVSQIILRIVTAALSLAFAPADPMLAEFFVISPEMLAGECSILAICAAGMRMRVIWAAVPLVGFEVNEIITAASAGFAAADLNALFSAALAFAALCGIYHAIRLGLPEPGLPKATPSHGRAIRKPLAALQPVPVRNTTKAPRP